MPEDGIGPVGSITSRSGRQIDVLYDGPNKFVGLTDKEGTVFIFDVSEAQQVIALMQEAIALTEA